MTGPGTGFPKSHATQQEGGCKGFFWAVPFSFLKREEIFAAYNLKALGSKTFGQLDIIEMGKIYLAILEMKKFKVYLVNDAARGMTMDFAIQFKEKLDNLWDEGALVLFLTTDPLLIKKWQPGMYFHEDYTWCDIVVSHTDLKRSDDEPS